MKLAVWVLNKVLLTPWAEVKDQKNAFFLEIAPGLSSTSLAPLGVSHVDLNRLDKDSNVSCLFK